MKTIENYNLEGKKVIIRCDFNVPLRGQRIMDDTRIRESLETINYAIKHKAKVILMSHLGKVKTTEDKEKNSLYPVSVKLSKLLKKEVLFSKETHGDELTKMVNELKDGDVLLIENTRYEDIEGKKESGCDLELSKYWASLGDIFINDAYGTLHRIHASNVGIAKLLPNGIGFLIKKEITKLDEIIKDKSHPFIVIMGGKKASDKIKVIENLIKKCDKILIGGSLCYTFLYALGYNVGKSIIDEESINFCQNMLKKYNKKIILPVDTVCSSGKVLKINKIGNDDVCLDIGPKTIKLFTKNLKKAGKVIMNGPMGMFEEETYAKGTIGIYSYLAKHHIKTLIGGGDSASAVNNLGFSDKFYHVSTGGGATLEYLSGVKLPGLEVINK